MEAVKARRIGLWVLFTALLAGIVWDSIMQGVHGLTYTVSWAVWEAYRQNPIITLAAVLPVGIILGHLFWSGYNDAQKEIEYRDNLLARARGYINRTGDPLETQLCDLIDSLLETKVRQ